MYEAFHNLPQAHSPPNQTQLLAHPDYSAICQTSRVLVQDVPSAGEVPPAHPPHLSSTHLPTHPTGPEARSCLSVSQMPDSVLAYITIHFIGI